MFHSTLFDRLSFLSKTSILFLLLSFAIAGKAQTILSPGDIVVIGILTNDNTDDEDDAIKLATLVDLTCGTKFIVTDNNWRTSTGTWYCDNNEFGLEITVTSKICAGSIIYLNVKNVTGTISTSSGAATRTSLGNPWGTDPGLSSGGDNVFVLQGTRTAPVFIFGLKHNGPFADIDCSTGSNPKDNSDKPTSLTLGTTAIEMSSSEDQWHYNCSNTTSGTKAALLASIGNKTKWTKNGGQHWDNSTCLFTVTDPCTAPTHKPTTFTSSSITQTSATISWSNCTVNPGNTKVLVIARASTPVTTDPSSGTNYVASAVYGSGNAIGSGFAVFNGTGTSVNLTGLTAGTNYYFSVYEYSCTGNCYNIDDLPGSILTSTPLPVELIYFYVNEKENSVILEWATASEKNNDRFEIEASKDGFNYTTVGVVPGHNNSQKIIQYEYLYAENVSYQYFRIKEVDLNNSYQYSKTEYLFLEVAPEPELFPVPATDEIFVRINNTSSKITVIDMLGKELYILEHSPEDVNSVYPIDLKSFPRGLYFILFESNQQIKRKSFSKI